VSIAERSRSTIILMSSGKQMEGRREWQVIAILAAGRAHESRGLDPVLQFQAEIERLSRRAIGCGERRYLFT